jgi:hypothetical protein
MRQLELLKRPNYLQDRFLIRHHYRLLAKIVLQLVAVILSGLVWRCLRWLELSSYICRAVLYRLLVQFSTIKVHLFSFLVFQISVLFRLVFFT